MKNKAVALSVMGFGIGGAVMGISSMAIGVAFAKEKMLFRAAIMMVAGGAAAYAAPKLAIEVFGVGESGN